MQPSPGARNGHAAGAPTEPDHWLSESVHIRHADGRRRISPAPASTAATVILSSAPTPGIAWHPVRIALAVMGLITLIIVALVAAGGR